MRVKRVKQAPVEVKRDRWTVLDVEEKAIDLVKQFSKKYNKTTGDALSEVIIKALS